MLGQNFSPNQYFVGISLLASSLRIPSLFQPPYSDLSAASYLAILHTVPSLVQFALSFSSTSWFLQEYSTPYNQATRKGRSPKTNRDQAYHSYVLLPHSLQYLASPGCSVSLLLAMAACSSNICSAYSIRFKAS